MILFQSAFLKFSNPKKYELLLETIFPKNNWVFSFISYSTVYGKYIFKEWIVLVFKFVGTYCKKILRVFFLSTRPLKGVSRALSSANKPELQDFIEIIDLNFKSLFFSLILLRLSYVIFQSQGILFCLKNVYTINHSYKLTWLVKL